MSDGADNPAPSSAVACDTDTGYELSAVEGVGDKPKAAKHRHDEHGVADYLQHRPSPVSPRRHLLMSLDLDRPPRPGLVAGDVSSNRVVRVL
jgi:hypothetical protein